MLDLNNSRVRASRPVALASTVTNLEEGVAMVAILENGKEVVVPSTGVGSTENFVGVSCFEVQDTRYAPFYQEITVPASSPYTVTLKRAPRNLPTDVGVMQLDGTAFAYSASAPTASQWTGSGNVLTFNSADAGKKLRVTGTYEPTAVEIQAIYGQSYPNSHPEQVVGVIGVWYETEYLLTTCFDPKSNWWGTSAGPVYLGANGRFTLTNTGTLLRHVTIYSAPNAQNGFLGLRMNV